MRCVCVSRATCFSFLTEMTPTPKANVPVLIHLCFWVHTCNYLSASVCIWLLMSRAVTTTAAVAMAAVTSLADWTIPQMLIRWHFTQPQFREQIRANCCTAIPYYYVECRQETETLKQSCQSGLCRVVDETPSDLATQQSSKMFKTRQFSNN